TIVVPSNGLARELQTESPRFASKLRVLANPVDIQRTKWPPDFERCAMRKAMNLGSDDIGLLFVALGHFERKGLPLILQAMTQLPANAKLNVVGGETSQIEPYKKRASQLEIASRVRFHGMQRDVRPYLWASDLFLLPSVYEV